MNVTKNKAVTTISISEDVFREWRRLNPKRNLSKRLTEYLRAELRGENLNMDFVKAQEKKEELVEERAEIDRKIAIVQGIINAEVERQDKEFYYKLKGGQNG